VRGGVEVTRITVEGQPDLDLRLQHLDRVAADPRVLRADQSQVARALAQHMLAAQGCGTQMARHPEGYPLWPAGYIGSLAHAGDTIGVVLGHDTQYRGLGVDVEHPSRVHPEVWLNVFTAHERSTLAAQPEDQRRWGAAIRFAAKEAAYKALYPRHGAVAGFFDTEVTVEDEVQAQARRQGSVQVVVHAPTLACTLEGRWFEHAGYVVVVVWDA
jgi:4'-phosphopantetheinyl transferase EntD